MSAEERRSLIELYGKALEGFDKTIVAVSSGAMVLSVTFLHDLAPKPTTASMIPLWVGWGGLLLCLVLIIISMLTGQRALELALEERKEVTRFSTITTWLNVTSAIALILGLGGLAGFAHVNMFQSDAAIAPGPCSTELEKAQQQLQALQRIVEALKDKP